MGGKGLAVINADQKWSSQWRAQAGSSRQVTFGLSESADYRATDIDHQGLEGTEFRLEGPTFSVSVSLRLAGDQHVSNALAALAVAIELGVAPQHAADGVARVTAGVGRGAITRRAGGGMVIDDTYNANPAAVKAALDVLARESGYRVLLLGPMLELGATSEALHTDVGRYAREKDIDLLITVGDEAAPAAEAFGGSALSFSDQISLHSDFPALPEEHVLWVKGSRAAGLERTVAWLLSSEEAASC